MKISDIDKNFKVESKISEPDVHWIDATSECFSLFGVFAPDKDDEWYHRMPRDVAAKVNEGVAWGYRDTAGGRLRFRTDSRYVAIHTKQNFNLFAHMPLSGSSGFDLYASNDGGTERFVGTYFPPVEKCDGYEGIFFLPEGVNQVLIHFPLYCQVRELAIGLCENATVEPVPEYRTKLPVITYGSSITQGGCASHAGNCYQAILSRKLDCDHRNIGFSGSAHGEPIMAEYLAKQPMSAFVLDYDHNAYTAKFLRNTHKPFFDTVRSANPDLPIIILNKPMYLPNADDTERKKIIYDTYISAVNSGDKNVYFIDFNHIFDNNVEDGWAVDRCHPSDSGFYVMASAIEPVLKKILYGE